MEIGNRIASRYDVTPLLGTLLISRSKKQHQSGIDVFIALAVLGLDFMDKILLCVSACPSVPHAIIA